MPHPPQRRPGPIDDPAAADAPADEQAADEQAAVVATLARDLDAALADEPWGRMPLVLVGLETRADTLVPADPGRPDVGAGCGGLEALVGFRAPSSWLGLIVVAEGWATLLDEPVPHDRQQVRVVFLLHRSGACASLVRVVGGDVLVDDSSPEVVGRLSDHCHRVLGLPTPPPPESTTELWAALWLDRVMRRVTDQPDWTPAWPEVEALHPAFDGCGTAHGLDAAARRLASEWSWAGLRRAAVGGDSPVTTVGPADAEWSDDGSFARHVLSSLPSTAELVDDLSLLLPQRVVDRIVGMLASWTLRAPRRDGP